MIRIIPTTPIDGQTTGTSGLRKKVQVVQQPNYVENWVQSLFTALGDLSGKTLVVGGDGRFYNSVAIQKIIQIAGGNGLAKLLVGHNGLLSTPAVSSIIRATRADGGIILTASHNPGGPQGDFGLKFNTANGAPALESVTGRIYEETQRIAEIRMLECQVDLSQVGTQCVSDSFEVEIIDSCEVHLALMEEIFDFALIRGLLANPQFSFVFDALHGVLGVYAQRLFVERLGASPACLANCVPKGDFGGGHPDPNLVYAKDLVARMFGENAPTFGAAGDGDGDRNMVLGDNFFISPADSLAIIADLHRCIPYFREGIRGLARSMPTCAAVDRVAQHHGVQCYEVPTGWKYFGNLMDDGRISICGEESFGTGSVHIREKDGLWAVLAWLNILAAQSRDAGRVVSVREVVEAHWRKYGRHLALRYDYENVSAESANAMMEHMTQNAVGKDAAALAALCGNASCAGGPKACDSFTYVDPVDASVAANQGLRFMFNDGSRFVVRLSGTGSVGATIRVYFEGYLPADAPSFDVDPKESLAPIIAAALHATQIARLTGREQPTVIT